MQRIKSRQLFLLVFLFSITCFNPSLSESIKKTPTISIIIDDIGYRTREDIRAIALPGPIAYAIMPHSPNAEKMSRLASQHGKDVLLHLPMEAVVMEDNQSLGPGALILDMTREEFIQTFNANLRSVPDAIGVNNHMGSLLTRHPGHMEWLMESLSDKKIFYIDSVTSKQSIANTIAKEKNVPYQKRDIFLDNIKDEKYIQNQFEELIKLAKWKGSAIAIGHPHPETIQVLSAILQNLGKYGVELVSIREIVIGENKKADRQQATLVGLGVGE